MFAREIKKRHAICATSALEIVNSVFIFATYRDDVLFEISIDSNRNFVPVFICSAHDNDIRELCTSREYANEMKFSCCFT